MKTKTKLFPFSFYLFPFIFYLFTFIFLLLSFSLFSQTGLRINGAKIIIPSGAIVWIDGGQNGDLTSSNSTTEGRIDLDGTIKIEGDWVNNNTSDDVLINQDTDGTIDFAGSSTQNLSGSATDDYTFEKLKVSSGANLVLDDDQSLILGGDFTLTGHFRVNSTSSGTGSFFDNGTITQTGTAQVGRYVDGASGGKNHYYSPAVSNATGTQLWVASKGNYTPSLFNQGTQSFDFITKSTSLTAGRGYVVAYNDTNTIYVKGNLNYGSVNYDISDDLDDWNLIGNPYPSGLDADDFLTTNASGGSPSIYGTLYFWDEGTIKDVNDYASWNGTGSARGNSGGTTPTKYVGTGQAFFVQSKAKTSNSVSYTNNMREVTNTQFFLPKPKYIQRIKISVTNSEGAFNEILIGFLDGATYGVDNLYDGHKLPGNPNLSFYSFIKGSSDKFVIQGMPLLNRNEIIPLGLRITKDGEYVFKKEMLENFAGGTEIYFYDKLLEKEYDLNLIEEIKYNLNAGEINDRFEIRFFPALNDIENKEIASPVFQPNIRVDGKTIIVENAQAFSGTIQIVDMLGKGLINKKIDNSSFESIWVNEAKGYYLVSIHNDQWSYSKKVFVY